MKKINIFITTMIYFLFYFVISYFLDFYFGLPTNFFAMVLIGLIFSIPLILFLVYDLHNKLADKLLGEKKETIVENEEDEEFFVPEENMEEVIAHEENA